MGPAEQQRQRLTILLEEYKALRAEIIQQVGLQAQIVTIGGTVVAAFLAAVAGMLNLTAPNYFLVRWVLLFAPFFAFSLSMWLAAKDDMIVALAICIVERIKPELCKLVQGNVLFWENYKLTSHRDRFVAGKFVSAFPHAFFILVAILCELVVTHLGYGIDGSQLWILSFDCILLAVQIYIALQTARSYEELTKISNQVELLLQRESAAW